MTIKKLNGGESFKEALDNLEVFTDEEINAIVQEFLKKRSEEKNLKDKSDLFFKSKKGEKYYYGVHIDDYLRVFADPYRANLLDDYYYDHGLMFSTGENCVEHFKKLRATVAYKRACWELYGEPSGEDYRNIDIKVYFLRTKVKLINIFPVFSLGSEYCNYTPGVVYMKNIPDIEKMKEHMGEKLWDVYWSKFIAVKK